MNTLKGGLGNEPYKLYRRGLPTGSRRRIFSDPPRAHVDNPIQSDMKLSLLKKEWNYGCPVLIQKYHQDTPCVGEYVPCGNDGIGAHVETLVDSKLPTGFPQSLGKLLRIKFSQFFGMFLRRSFPQSLGKPCSVYVISNKPDNTPGKLKLPFYHDGFTTLPQALLLLSFWPPSGKSYNFGTKPKIGS